MKKSILLLATFAFGIILFQSCQKTDSNTDNALITTAEDLSVHEDYAEQVDIDADMVVEERGGGGTCPTITFAQPEGTWPNTITIDFGTACTRPDGRVLSGKLIIDQTAEIRTPGAVRTLTHDNFYVDGIKVEGTKTWTNLGQDANGLWSFTKVASDMKLTFEDGSSTTW
ncbi:MAG: hypothetical protein JNJ57_00520, partial [Saprospiraceae bacterium]|nr:hypothetical protein [Saprospiraceae bacterium]